MKEDSPAQIPFVQEVLRKTTHMIALVIPGGYHFLGLDKSTMLAIMIPITLLMILIDISRLRGWWLWRSVFCAPFSPHDPCSRTAGRLHRGDLYPHFGVCHGGVV